MKKTTSMMACIGVAVLMSGCTNVERGMLAGGAIGAGAGAIWGASTSAAVSAGEGTAIGAVIGSNAELPAGFASAGLVAAVVALGLGAVVVLAAGAAGVGLEQPAARHRSPHPTRPTPLQAAEVTQGASS